MTPQDLTPQTLPATVDENVTSLVQLAIERGVDVAVLERLVALQERVTVRNARAAYFEALSTFQDQCPEILKTKTANIKTRSGGSYAYTYAPLEVITRAIRPVLKACGLSYSWDVSSADKCLLITCIVRHIEGHEERSSFPVPIETDAAMSGAQKNGAALTYGRRQSLVAVLGLTTADEDVDGAKIETSERITRQQSADLDVLIDEVGADRTRFLRWMRVDRLGDISSRDYARAVSELEKKRQAVL